MAKTDWMIYGATGFTGTLVAEEAVRRGHRPVLAGRSPDKLKELGKRLGLPTRTVELDDAAQLAQVVAGMKLVYHCAGPFSQTAGPMIRACLKAGAHYLDITGEIAVFENTLAFDSLARERGVALISGCGFDVIPTDCLANSLASSVKDPLELELGIAVTSSRPSVSGGTLRTTIEGMARGGLERRSGKLAVLPLGQGGKVVRFPGGDRYLLPIPTGDLATAFASTRIQNITTYFNVSRFQAAMLRLISPLFTILFNIPQVRRAAQNTFSGMAKGPTQQQREEGRSIIWARVMDVRGQSSEAFIEVLEGYQFTAVAGVSAIEKVLQGNITGAKTPAQAFGPDFVFEIPGTRKL